jgi:acid phosphatase
MAFRLNQKKRESMRHKFWIALLMLSCAVAAFAAMPQSKHVVLIVEENHSFDNVITQGGMPYLKSLAEKHTILVNYYANHHPSMGNYFTMTTGQTISTDDHYGGVVQDENLVSQLIGANRKPFVKKHFPMAYFTNVRDDDKQRMNLVPYDQFVQDLKGGALPDFSMVIPDEDHDAHDGTLQEADNWLKQCIAPLLEDPGFQRDGVLIITFDEAVKSDSSHGGGHITTVVIGPQVKEKFADNTFYQHQSLLATIEDLLGLPRLKQTEKVPSFTNAFK